MVEEVRREFPRYPIRLGLECDYIPGYEGHIQTLAGQAEWDYLIGSVHYITPGWDVDNPKHLKRWKEQPVEENLAGLFCRLHENGPRAVSSTSWPTRIW